MNRAMNRFGPSSADKAGELVAELRGIVSTVTGLARLGAELEIMHAGGATSADDAATVREIADRGRAELFTAIDLLASHGGDLAERLADLTAAEDKGGEGA